MAKSQILTVILKSKKFNRNQQFRRTLEKLSLQNWKSQIFQTKVGKFLLSNFSFVGCRNFENCKYISKYGRYEHGCKKVSCSAWICLFVAWATFLKSWVGKHYFHSYGDEELIGQAISLFMRKISKWKQRTRMLRQPERQTRICVKTKRGKISL